MIAGRVPPRPWTKQSEPHRADEAVLSSPSASTPMAPRLHLNRGEGRKMKLSIPRSELQRGLGRIQAIVEKRNSMPILANAFLRASKGDANQLEIAATDLEVGIRGFHPADVSKAGSLTVSARKLFEIVRELPDEPVQLASTAELVSRDPLWSFALHARRYRGGGVPDAPRVFAHCDGEAPCSCRLESDRADHVRRVRRRDPLQPEWRLFRAGARTVRRSAWSQPMAIASRWSTAS